MTSMPGLNSAFSTHLKEVLSPLMCSPKKEPDKDTGLSREFNKGYLFLFLYVFIEHNFILGLGFNQVCLIKCVNNGTGKRELMEQSIYLVSMGT